MFKYRKAELFTYLAIILLSVIFSILLIAYGYNAWFLFAVLIVIAPCGFSLHKIISYNILFSKIEKFYINSDYKTLDSYAEKNRKRFPFVRVFQINGYLESGNIDKYSEAYTGYKEKRSLAKTWQFKLESYKVFYDLLSGATVEPKIAMRLESNVDAEEVEIERNLCKTLDYFFRGDYERAEKQLGWLSKEGGSAFLKFVTQYVRYLTKAVFGEGEELSASLRDEACNEFLKNSLNYLENRITQICTRETKDEAINLKDIK